MNRRPHGRKPTIALWMLVALADLLILSAATGVLIPLVFAVVVVVVGGFAAVRMLTRQSDLARSRVRR